LSVALLIGRNALPVALEEVDFCLIELGKQRLELLLDFLVALKLVIVVVDPVLQLGCASLVGLVGRGGIQDVFARGRPSVPSLCRQYLVLVWLQGTWLIFLDSVQAEVG